MKLHQKIYVSALLGHAAYDWLPTSHVGVTAESEILLENEGGKDKSVLINGEKKLKKQKLALVPV